MFSDQFKSDHSDSGECKRETRTKNVPSVTEAQRWLANHRLKGELFEVATKVLTSEKTGASYALPFTVESRFDYFDQNCRRSSSENCQ